MQQTSFLRYLSAGTGGDGQEAQGRVGVVSAVAERFPERDDIGQCLRHCHELVSQVGIFRQESRRALARTCGQCSHHHSAQREQSSSTMYVSLLLVFLIKIISIVHLLYSFGSVRLCTIVARIVAAVPPTLRRRSRDLDTFVNQPFRFCCFTYSSVSV